MELRRVLLRIVLSWLELDEVQVRQHGPRRNTSARLWHVIQVSQFWQYPDFLSSALTRGNNCNSYRSIGHWTFFSFIDGLTFQELELCKYVELSQSDAWPLKRNDLV
jgi:hypothetical protein